MPMLQSQEAPSGASLRSHILIVVAIAFLALLVGMLFARLKRHRLAAECDRTSPLLKGFDTTVDALPQKSVEALRALYGEPVGKFFHGRCGITHYSLTEPSEQGPNGNKTKLAVLIHGVKSDLRIYDPKISKVLAASGFSVLCYDYYGHGWSHGDEGTRMDPETMQTQLFDLIDHVLAPEEQVDLLVGHSAGGLLAAHAIASGRRQFRRVVMISPALGTSSEAGRKFQRAAIIAKPLLLFKPLKLLFHGQMEQIDKNYAHEGGQYFYPELHSASKEEWTRMIKLHPQIVKSIVGIVFDLVNMAEDSPPAFQSLVASGNVPPIRLLWGTHEKVIPIESAHKILAWPGAEKCVSLRMLEKLGHAAPKEDPSLVASEIVKFATAPTNAAQ